MKLNLKSKKTIKDFQRVTKSLSYTNSNQLILRAVDGGLELHTTGPSRALTTKALVKEDSENVEFDSRGIEHLAVNTFDFNESMKQFKKSESIVIEVPKDLSKIIIREDMENPTKVKLPLHEYQKAQAKIEVEGGLDFDELIDPLSIEVEIDRKELKQYIKSSTAFEDDATMIFKRADDGSSVRIEAETHGKEISKVLGDDYMKSYGEPKDFEVWTDSSILRNSFHNLKRGDDKIIMKLGDEVPCLVREETEDILSRAIIAPRIPEA